MYWRSILVYRENKIIVGGGGIIHRKSEVTVDSSTKWCEGGCSVTIEFGTVVLDTLEGGVCGSMGNG